MKHLLVWLKRSSFFIKKVLEYNFGFLIFVTLPATPKTFVLGTKVEQLRELL
jgi:hypothetical protein